MQKKNLGDTGLHVTTMGLGLAALGRPGYINLEHAKDLRGNYVPSEMEKHSHDVLNAAWAEGIRYFDAARSYGMAETFLCSWLKTTQLHPNDLTVASKWGYTYTADWKVDVDTHEIKNHSLERLKTQWQESNSLLGEFLNIYYIHSATKESGVLENKEVLDELYQLSKLGIVIGLTVSGKDQAETIRQALKIRVNKTRLFQCVQATWNLLEQSTGAALQEAHEQGVGVIVKEVLANGRLTDRNNDPKFVQKKMRLKEEASRLNTTIDALSIAAVLSQPWVDVVLSGAATVDQIQSNLKALNIQLDDRTTNQLLSISEPPEEYWSYRSKLEWN